MSNEVTAIKKKLREQASACFLNQLVSDRDYKVRQVHYGNHDVCKVWRCGSRRQAYHFFVTALPGTLMVHGDMGTYVWSRVYDMIEFAQQSIDDLSYFTSKLVVPASVVEWQDELIHNWLYVGIQQREAELQLPWDDSSETALSELKCIWRETGDAEEMVRHYLHSVTFSSLDYDPSSSLKYYSYHYLWSIEALKWFLSRLRVGDVVPPVLPDEQACTERAIESSNQFCERFGIVGSIKFPDLGGIALSALPIVNLEGYRWEVLEGVNPVDVGALRVLEKSDDDKYPYSRTVALESVEFDREAEQPKSVFVGEKCTVVVAYWHGFDCGPCLVVLENELREYMGSETW